jgi:hypothetical protein
MGPRTTAAAVAVLALALLAARAEAECAATELTYLAFSTETTTGGALVVGRISRVPPQPRVPARAPEIVLADGSRVAVREETIAPGLVRLVPARPLPAGAHRVEHLGWPAPLTVTASAPSAPPPAPRPTAITITRTQRRWDESITATATLAAPIPDGVVAVVVRSEGGAASTWQQIETTGVAIVGIHASEGRCAQSIPGRVPPAAGERVRLAWVDRTGRVSAWSAPIAAPR